jgi:TonB-dependent SusC/RagA subfamily outer membrane receptor
MKLKKPVTSWSFLLLSAMLVIFAGFADEDLRFRRIKEALDRFTIVYPQQKAYLHLDKAVYDGGDVMRVKAYLLNGLNHLPDTLSTNLYVELISPFKTRVEIKRIQLFRGFGIGDFVLSDTLPEGLYQIRAFTNWMQNFSVDFYFEKNFQVINPVYQTIISPREAKENQKELDSRDKLDSDIDLQFMPEGGSLVAGLESMVGFKAVNRLGMGVETEGSVVDDNGHVVASLKSFYKGIGTFSFTPQKGRKYFAIAVFEGREQRFPLPRSIENGLVMHVTDTPDQFTVSLNSNRMSTADRTANEVIIVCQLGGKIYAHKTVSLESGSQDIGISKKYFPGGIIHITAFSGRGQPLAERLVFNNRHDFMKIRYTATDTLTQAGKKIKIDLTATDPGNMPLAANLSLSVVREKTLQVPVNNDNIISNLLLTSDIQGYIEDPYAYFADNSPRMQQALDNLMVTQGWRRFSWEKILEGEYPEINYHEEKGISIYGQITHNFFGIPLKDCKVQLSILNAYNDVFTQYSSEKGYFLFEDMVYYDTIDVKIEAWRTSGRRNLLILLPEDKINEVKGLVGDHSLITQSERDNKAFRIERNTEAKIAYTKEQERLKEERENELQSIHGEPDYVLRSDDFPKGNRDILEVLQGRVPGVMIHGSQVIIRGPSSILGSNQPLFLLDGMPTMDVSAIRAIPVEQIDRVEVLKGPSAAIYGMRGANGVIAVYTKRGQYMQRGVIEFSMLGYATPRSFYQPKYLPENEPVNNYTLLWNPVVLTNASGKASMLLDKPEITGEYRIVIEGVSYMGHVGRMEEVVVNE